MPSLDLDTSQWGIRPPPESISHHARHALSRRAFIGTIGGVTFQLSFFGPGLDPSSITDFNGFVGVADVQGTGTATSSDGSTETLLFDTDMRFMSGVYVGQDGAVHKGTFGFV